jgi:hypothetical protein
VHLLEKTVMACVFNGPQKRFQWPSL